VTRSSSTLFCELCSSSSHFMSCRTAGSPHTPSLVTAGKIARTTIIHCGWDTAWPQRPNWPHPHSARMSVDSNPLCQNNSQYRMFARYDPMEDE